MILPMDIQNYFQIEARNFEQVSDKWIVALEKDKQKANYFYTEMLLLYETRLRPFRVTVSRLYPHLEIVFEAIENTLPQLENCSEVAH